jgi:signal transduction histidine kinase
VRTQELTAALEREKELSELKSRFVALASHEFRTPLSAILSSASLIGHYKDWDQDDKRQKHINRIKSSVGHLTDILDEFLSLEKLEQGKVDVLRATFNLQEFMEDIVSEMEGMLAKKDQKINSTYEGQAEIFLDKKILRHILLNLLSNAAKYSAHGKFIHLSTSIRNAIVTISVKDEGVGIPEDAQRGIFSKFFRAGNVSHIQGTGLGLNIVQKYVDLLGGAIDFSSRVNEGSVFTVRFPLA